MTDKELADAVVAIGVGAINSLDTSIYRPPFDRVAGIPYSATQFVTDWRVAGKLMEKCESVNLVNAGSGKFSAMAFKTRGSNDFNMSMNESPARAMIEACVLALKKLDDGEQQAAALSEIDR